jgi:hypothetical protein
MSRRRGPLSLPNMQHSNSRLPFLSVKYGHDGSGLLPPAHRLASGDFEFRISNFRKRFGKRATCTGGAWHPRRVHRRCLASPAPSLEVPGIPGAFIGGAWHPDMTLSSTSCRRAWHLTGNALKTDRASAWLASSRGSSPNQGARRIRQRLTGARELTREQRRVLSLQHTDLEIGDIRLMGCRGD